MKRSFRIVHVLTNIRSQSTIRNTFRTAGFGCSNIKNIGNTTINIVTLIPKKKFLLTISGQPLQNLDLLLVHLNIGGQSLSATDFIGVEEETPTFNEWNDVDNSLIIVDAQRHYNDEDYDMPTETPPNAMEAMKLVRRLYLSAATQQPQLHSLTSQLDSQRIQVSLTRKKSNRQQSTIFFIEIEYYV